jgi:hypothetical protein
MEVQDASGALVHFFFALADNRRIFQATGSTADRNEIFAGVSVHNRERGQQKCCSSWRRQHPDRDGRQIGEKYRNATSYRIRRTGSGKQHSLQIIEAQRKRMQSRDSRLDQGDYVSRFALPRILSSAR